jgi:hypothetical protein
MLTYVLYMLQFKLKLSYLGVPYYCSIWTVKAYIEFQT